MPVDGTFRLRALKDQLDGQLPARRAAAHATAGSRHSTANTRLIPGTSEESFQVFNFASGLYEYRPGKLVAAGKECLLFVERGQEAQYGQASADVYASIVKCFDDKVFPSVCRWFGKPVVPAAFNLPDERIYIFLVDIHDGFAEGYVAGYFDHRDLEGWSGNQKPVFFMDTNPGEPGDPEDKSNAFYRTLAHEFQHMVNFSIQHANGNPEQERWLDEGFSMFSEYVFSGETGQKNLRVPPTPHFARFLQNPAVNLLSNAKESWFHEDRLFRQYGASFLFVAYLVEKFGGETAGMQQQFTRELVRTAAKGVKGLNELLRHANTSFTEVFVNFNLALAVDEPGLANGLWGFVDKAAAFGDDANLLPIKTNRHFIAGSENSFAGAESSVAANCLNVEEINGRGQTTLSLTCQSHLLPWAAMIHNDGTTSIRPLVIDSDGHGSITLDFSNLRRFFFLPLVIDPQINGDENFSYSFRTAYNQYLLYPVPHPAFAEQYLIFFRSFNGAVNATPELRVLFNNLVEQPVFLPVNDEKSLFVAQYKLPGVGRGQAVCNLNDEVFSFSFSAARLRPSVRTEMQIADALLVNDGNVVDEELVMFAVPDCRSLVRPANAVAGPFDVLAAEETKTSLVVEIPDYYGNRSGLRSEGPGSKKAWAPLKKRTDGRMSADLGGPGRFYLFYDDRCPSISGLRLEKSPHGQNVVLSSEDDLSGVNPDSLKITIGGRQLPGARISEDGRVSYRIPENFSGSGELVVTLADRAGNETRASVKAQIVAASRITASGVYPNPCQRFARFSFVLSGKPVLGTAVVNLYDVSGKKINALQLDESAGHLIADWNLSHRNGSQVANGVYFFRARIEADGRILRSNGKLAVLR